MNGVCASPKIEHGQFTVTGTVDGVVWRLPLSSVARTRIDSAPVPPSEPV